MVKTANTFNEFPPKRTRAFRVKGQVLTQPPPVQQAKKKRRRSRGSRTNDTKLAQKLLINSVCSQKTRVNASQPVHRTCQNAAWDWPHSEPSSTTTTASRSSTHRCSLYAYNCHRPTLPPRWRWSATTNWFWTSNGWKSTAAGYPDRRKCTLVWVVPHAFRLKSLPEVMSIDYLNRLVCTPP